MSYQTLDVDQFFKLESPYIKVGLSWDILDKETVDLDANCVLFNSYAKIIDAVYYNQLKLEDGSIKHSGDNKTGEGEGEDESILIDLTKISKDVKALIVSICCYKTGDFSKVETAKVHVTNAETTQPLVQISLGCQGKHTSLIACTIFQDQGIWYIKNIQRAVDGRDFKQIEIYMQQQLEFLIPKDIQREVKFDPYSDKVFIMKKNDVVGIESEKYVLGLGWDSRCDLDSSVCLLDYKAKEEECIFFRNKTSKNSSVVHSGDNTTGVGSGDDETITIDLPKIDKNYSTIFLVISVYTSGMSFRDVSGAYCRLLNSKGKEMLRYSLSEKNLNCNSMIMAKIERMDGEVWRFKALGEKAYGRTVVDSIDALKKFHFLNQKVQEEQNRIAKEKRRNEIQKRLNDVRLDLDEKKIQYEKVPKKIKSKQSTFKILCKGHNLDKKDFFGKSDPYYIIYYHKNKIAQSEVIKKTLNPEWKEVHFELTGSIEELKFEELFIKVFDWNAIMEHSLIGTFTVMIRDVIDKETKPVVNENIKKQGYQDSGKFEFSSCEVSEKELEIDNNEYYNLDKQIKDLTKREINIKNELEEFNKNDQE